MAFLTILGDTEILCSFKLVLEGESGKEIHPSKHFNKLLKTDTLHWKQMYLPPHLVTIDSYWRSFQYKILKNKSQMVLGDNSDVCRKCEKKLVGGSFCPQPHPG